MDAKEGGNPAAFLEGDSLMRKYLFAWLLGVPAGILILIYFFAHVL
jgi:hypothetical protein